jgi:hypothetical protein
MLNQRDITGIVTYLRNREEPLPVASIDDVKAHPNSTLLSYYIEGVHPTRDELAEELLYPERMGEWLSIAAINAAKPPFEFPAQLLTRPEMPGFAEIMIRSSGGFAYSYGNALVVGKPQDAEFTYPSGKIVQYKRLVHEQTANASIFDMALSDFETRTMYVRENSLKMLGAVYDTVNGDPAFSRFRGVSFEQMTGIILAHELCEIRIFEEGRVPKSRMELELQVEREEKVFLDLQGVHPLVYELFHTLRAGNAPGVSRAVVDAGFRP